jgi:hypothetical protein
MDPYLEGYLWPDVHNALASKIRQQLTPLLRPRYTARLSIYVVEDTTPEGDIGIMYPDVEIMQPRPTSERLQLPGAPLPLAEIGHAIGTPATLSIPIVLPIEAQLTNVEIRDTASNQLVTCIEIVSPINKRAPGLMLYRQKRQRLYQAGVHLLELDLLRRGMRLVTHPRLPNVPYLLMLTRAHAGKTDVWPVTLREPLPTLPVPLHPPDEDVPLDLSTALHAIYDEAAYDLSIDYQQAPPPPLLSEADTQWIRALLQQQ